MQQELSYQVIAIPCISVSLPFPAYSVLYQVCVRACVCVCVCVQADKIHREYQSELREQLKRQTDSHKRLLTEALDTQVHIATPASTGGVGFHW